MQADWQNWATDDTLHTDFDSLCVRIRRLHGIAAAPLHDLAGHARSTEASKAATAAATALRKANKSLESLATAMQNERTLYGE